MKAITLPEFGGPDALVLADVDTPTPRAGEVLVRGRRRGRQPRRPAPAAGPLRAAGRCVAGSRASRCSGVVEALGEGVDGWAVGDEVCALLAGGGYAERVRRAGRAAAARAGGGRRSSTRRPCLRSPARCGRTSSCIASLAARRDVAGARRGVRHRHDGDPAGAAASARTSSSRRGRRAKLERLSRAGRRGAGQLPGGGLRRARSRSATDGHGADVVLDVIGAKYLSRNVSALATSGRAGHHRHAGRHPWRARHRGPDGQARGRHLDRRCGRGRRAEKATIVAAVREHVWPLVAAGSGAADRPVSPSAGGCRGSPPRARGERPRRARSCSPPAEPGLLAHDVSRHTLARLTARSKRLNASRLSSGHGRGVTT